LRFKPIEFDGFKTEEKLSYYNTPRIDAEQQIERLRVRKNEAVFYK
jgi:hypothetical protein